MLELMVDSRKTHQRKSNIVKRYSRLTDKFGYTVPDNRACLVKRAFEILVVASRSVDRFDYIFVLIKKGERRFCSASVNTDVKAHSPFSSSLKNSSQISSALYLLRLAGALSIHMPFVKSGTGTGMLPIAIDCSERQVIAIHVAAS